MTQAIQQADLQRLLDRRLERGDERVCKFADDTVGISLQAVVKDIDPDGMSCSFVFTTQGTDRSGDTVHTGGGKLDAYQQNPTSLFDHGKHPQIGKMPIGRCEDDGGKFTVVLNPEEGVGVCRIFFSKTFAWAKTVFDLIVEKMLRAVSVGILPLRASIKPEADPDDDNPPLDIFEWELCEISPTAVPDNKDCLRLALAKSLGRDGNRRAILEYLDRRSGPKEKSMSARPKLIAKSTLFDVLNLKRSDLTALAKSLGTISGKTPQNLQTVLSTIVGLPKDGLAKLNKALSKLTNKDAGGYGQMDDEGKIVDGEGKAMDSASLSDGAALIDDAGNEPLDKDAPIDDAGNKPASETEKDAPAWEQPLTGPAGPAAAADMHQRLLETLAACAGWGKRQENDAMGEQLEKIAETALQSVQDLAGTHEDQYPEEDKLPVPGETTKDAPADGDTPPDDDEDEEEDEDDDIEGDGTQKSVRGLRIKRFLKLGKRVGKLLVKRVNPLKLRIKRMAKAMCGTLTKAANFLGDAAKHDGDWTDGQRERADLHEKALRGILSKDMPGDDGGGSYDDPEMKSLRERAEKAEKLAEKAIGDIERFVKRSGLSLEEIGKAIKQYKATSR